MENISRLTSSSEKVFNMSNSPIEGYLLLMGPTRLTSRIFVGNLPPCSRKELAELCACYGKVLGTMIQGTFGFVQFESERQANIAIMALNLSRFKAKTLTAHSATFQSMEEHGYAPRQFGEDVLVTEADSSGQDLIADCEIIAMELIAFHEAMRIRDRLIEKGLCTEVRSPIAMDENEPLTSLAELAALGTQYAMVLTSVNGILGTAAVHYLYEDRSEHPGLTVDQAIEMVVSDFNRRHVFKSADGARN